MRERGQSSLANPVRTVGVAIAAALLALGLGGTAAGRADDITIYRCQDSAGHVTLQDEACAAGQRETSRSMTRPQDPAPRPVRVPPPDDQLVMPPEDGDYPPPPVWIPPPPPMFECTDFDGEVRFSETYEPNDRCVPLSVLGYDIQGSSSAAATCRWVHESCLRLDDASACDQFEKQLKEADSAALHADASHAPFRRSEAERLRRIVNESCR